MENNFQINEYETLPKEPLFKPEPPKSEVPSQGITNLLGDMKAASSEVLPSRSLQLGSSNEVLGIDRRLSLIKKGPPREAYVKLSDGTLKPRFDSYNTALSTQVNEEYLAGAQTKGEKWTNGIVKLGGKTLVNVAGGLVGTVDGLVQAIRFQSAASLYDNDVSNYLEDLNKKLDSSYSNYRSAAEKNMNFGQKLTTANFWADDVLGGLSFLAGTIISEGIWAAATGGSSLIAKGLIGEAGRAAVKIGAGKSLSALKTIARKEGKQILKAAAKSELEGVKTAGITAAKIQKGLNSTRFLYTSAGYESSIEAKGYLEQAREHFINETLSNQGRMPTAKELGSFHDASINAANGVFVANLGLVGFSNMTILGKLLLGKSTTRKLSNSFFNKNILGIGFKKEGSKLVALQPTKFQKNFGRAFSIGKPIFTEGVIEEGGQGAVSNAALKYVMSGYDTDATNDNLSIIDALTSGIAEEYTSKEGLTDVGLGALIGLFGGAVATRGKFNEVAEERENLNTSVQYHNQFTSDMLVDNMINSNKIAVASRQSEVASAKGDLTGEMSADTSGMAAVVERGLIHQDVGEIVEDFAVALETYDNVKLAELMGGTTQEAATWKAEKLQEFKGVAEAHSKNMQFAEAVLGDRNIAGLANIEGLDRRGQADLQSAIAYSLTMGQRSDEFAESLAVQIKQLIAKDLTAETSVDALNVNSVLQKVNDTQKANYYSSLNKMVKLQSQQKELETELIKAQNAPEVEEGGKAKANRLNAISLRLAEVQMAIEEASQAKTLAFDAMNIPQLSEEVITEDMLDAQQENVARLRESIDNLSMRNPQQSLIVGKLMEEYDKAIQQTKTFNNVVRTLVNPKTRVSTLNGWANAIINKKKKVDGNTAQMFVDATNTYLNDMVRNKVKSNEQVETEQEAATKKDEGDSADITQKNPLDNPPDDVVSNINDDAATIEQPPIETNPPLSVVDTLWQKVNEIINKNPYTTTRYTGNIKTTLNDAKPTQEQVDRYNELLGEILPNKDKQEVLRSPYEAVGTSGLTEEEHKELQDLNTKLNNWQILSGFNDNNSSISEILQLIAQLQEQFVPNNIQPDVKPKDFFRPTRGQEKSPNNDNTGMNTVISPDNAVANKVNGNYEISHVKIESLGNLFKGRVFIVEGGKALAIETIPKDKMLDYNQTPGTVVLVKGDNVELQFTTDERQRLVVPANELDQVVQNSNFRILNFDNSNYMPLFVFDANGNLTPLEGDFKIESILDNEVIILNAEAMYGMAPGTLLRTVVDLNDSYNNKLLDQYRNGLITEEFLANNLNIYLSEQGTVNETIGVLRAIKTSTATNTSTFSKLHMIRKQAVKKALSSSSSKVEVGIAIPFNFALITNPNVVVKESETGELIPQNIDFNKESIDMVDDFGYMVDGVLTTNKGKEYSSSEVIFAKSASLKEKNRGQKIPVIAFRFKGRTVVFPVSLTVSQTGKQQEVQNILENTNMSDVAKIYAINQILRDNNINPKDFPLSDLEGPNAEVEVSRILEAVSKIPTMANVEDWTNPNYSKNNLIGQAKIAIDITDKPFGAPKGILNFSAIDIPTEVDMEIESVDILDNFAKKVENIFREKQPFADMVNNTKFYDAFEEDGIDMQSDIYLNKKRNVNTLINAFNQAIPKSVREALGESLIKDIKKEIQQYQMIVKGLKTNKNALTSKLKNGIQNAQNNCK